MRILSLLPLLLTGCLSAVPAGPTTAPPAQVKACETFATVHNISVLGGIALTGVSGGLGTVETQVSNQNTKNEVADTIVGMAVMAAVAAALTGIEGSNYVQSGCPTLTGPLPPAAHLPSSDAGPSDLTVQ